MKNLFQGKTKKIEEEIDSYLDIISKAVLVFNEGAKEYLRGKHVRLENRCLDISDIERKADDLLDIIKYKLYTYMLIPDSRADVFELLNDMDDIVDTTKQVLLQLSIEKPEIPEFLEENFMEMAEASVNAVDEIIKGVRAFFKEPKMVGDYVNKVYFFEKEADKIEEKIKRKTFESEVITDLSRKMHIRYFAGKIALLSDKAEVIGQNLLIYSAKRAI